MISENCLKRNYMNKCEGVLLSYTGSNDAAWPCQGYRESRREFRREHVPFPVCLGFQVMNRVILTNQ